MKSILEIEYPDKIFRVEIKGDFSQKVNTLNTLFDQSTILKDVKQIKLYNINPCWSNRIRETCYKNYNFYKLMNIISTNNKLVSLAICQKCQFYMKCPGLFSANKSYIIEPIEKRYINIETYKRLFTLFRKSDKLSSKYLLNFEKSVLKYLEMTSKSQSFPLEFSIQYNSSKSFVRYYRYTIGLHQESNENTKYYINLFFNNILKKSIISELMKICFKMQAIGYKNIIIGVDANDKMPLFKIYFRKDIHNAISMIRYDINNLNSISLSKYYINKSKLNFCYYLNESSLRLLKNTFGIRKKIFNDCEVVSTITGLNEVNSIHINALSNNLRLDSFPNKYYNKFNDIVKLTDYCILTYIGIYKSGDILNFYYIIR